MKYYVPEYNSNNCVVYRGNGVIRVYEKKNFSQGTFNYIDYHIQDNYYTTTGSDTFSNYSQNYPICLNSSYVTTDVWYRTDIDSILVSFFIILIVCFYFPFKIFSRIFGRWLKV